MRTLCFYIALCLCAVKGFAIGNEMLLTDPDQEKRANALFKTIRCQVCQGEAIYDSRASLAQDLRLLVRTHIKEGKTDTQIKAYLVTRYGQDVLMETPIQHNTWALWFIPFILVGLGGYVISKQLN